MPHAPNADLSSHDRRTLDRIFQHPLTHNLDWREVVALLKSIGTADERHNGEVDLAVGSERLAMKKPHGKDVGADTVIDLRHLLERAGWSPDEAPALADTPPPPGLVVVIDHDGARIHHLGATTEDAAPGRHIRHHIERQQAGADREELYPDDEKFFEAVAVGLLEGGPIVLISHGKGQSNEADHLSAYLLARHKEVHARIVRQLVADLPHLTTPELLALGRNALG